MSKANLLKIITKSLSILIIVSAKAGGLNIDQSLVFQNINLFILVENKT